jgi:hypothetical protein
MAKSRIVSGVLFGAAALALAAMSPASAQNAQEREVLERHCTSDYLRLCNMYDPGSPEVEQCFTSRTAELSPNCRNAIAAFANKGSARRRQQ